MSNVTIGTDTVAVAKGQTNGTTTTATLAGDSLLFTTVNNADNTIVNQFSIAAGGIFDLIRATFKKGIDSNLAENHMADGTYTDPHPGVGHGLKVSQGLAADFIYVGNPKLTINSDPNSGTAFSADSGQGRYVFVCDNGQYFVMDDAYGASLLSSGQIRLAFNQGDATFRIESISGGSANLVVATVNGSSDRDLKKNIVDFEQTALDKINGTKVYQYHFKDEKDTAPKHLGVMAQEAPEEVAGVDAGKTVDLYAMSSLAWKAIQELSAKNAELEKRIAVLESK